jgi:DNA repair exonuclease SbcCD ATPase subunit
LQSRYAVDSMPRVRGGGDGGESSRKEVIDFPNGWGPIAVSHGQIRWCVMIRNISEDWDKIGGSVNRRAGDDGADEIQDLLQAVRGVQAALQAMSRVSVTRTTLRSAVEETLVPIIRDRGPELFASLRGGPVPQGEVEERLRGFEERIERLVEVESELQSAMAEDRQRVDSRLETVDDRLSTFDHRFEEIGLRLQEIADSVGEVNFRAAGIDDRLGATEERRMEIEAGVRAGESLRQEMEQLRASVEAQLRSGLLALEDRISGVRSGLEGLIAGVEGAIPAVVARKSSELEGKLRKEIDEMVHSMVNKLEELRGALGRIEETLPRRDEVRSVDEKLGRMEERFGVLSEHVKNIDSLTPDLRTLGDKLLELRDQVGRLGGSVTGDLGDMRSLLESGISRWEADQSQMVERLSAIKDSLRDQFKAVADHVQGQGTLWDKLTGKKEGTLRLSKDDWDRLSTKIEGIISGLESVLARRRAAE